MSEVTRIATTFDNWLAAELVDSRDGPNGVLDDFERMREGYADRDAMEAAMDVQKNSGHFGRYRLLTSELDESMLRSEDRLVARLIHHSLMFTSGGFRVESFLATTSQADYMARRFGRLYEPNGGSNVPIQGVVDEAIFMNADLATDMPAYRDMNEELNRKVLDNNRLVYHWFQDNPDRLQDALSEDEEPIQAMRNSQVNGLVLAASHVSIVAALRGIDARNVPILEPKSVSYAKLVTMDDIKRPEPQPDGDEQPDLLQ